MLLRGVPQEREELHDVFGMDQFGKLRGGKLCKLVSQRSLDRRALTQNEAGRVDHRDDVRRFLDKRAEARLTLPGRILGDQTGIFPDGRHLPDVDDGRQEQRAEDQLADGLSALRRRNQKEQDVGHPEREERNP